MNLIAGTTPTNGILGSTRKYLISPTTRDHEIARKGGFINAEHDALCFLASPWFFQLIEMCLSMRTYVPGQITAVEAGQGILDQAYDGQVRMNTREEIMQSRPPMLRAEPKPPDGRDYDYSIALRTGHRDVLSILGAYNEIIILERIERMRRRAGVSEDQGVLSMEFLQTAGASAW